MGAAVDFFSSPIGLGHVTRDIAIAQCLGRGGEEGGGRTGSGDAAAGMLPGFVTGGAAARMLQNLGFEVRDLYRDWPPFEVRDGSLQNPGRWLWGYYRYYKRCKAVCADVLESDRPGLVASDEDFASLSVAHRMGIRTVLITDIRQTRFTAGVASLAERAMNRSMQKMMRQCDCVILPEDGDCDGRTDEAQKDGGDWDNVRRVGPIVRQITSPRRVLRSMFGLERRTVTISIGGTDAGLFLIRKALEAISGMGLDDLDVVIVAGPTASAAASASAGTADGGRAYPDFCKNVRVRNIGFIDNLHELVFASDLLVSLAGRSTMDEAAAYGTPAVFVPIGGHFEQEDNAARRGFAFGDINRLGDLIAEGLDKKRGLSVPSDGARRAAEIIRSVAGG